MNIFSILRFTSQANALTLVIFSLSVVTAFASNTPTTTSLQKPPPTQKKTPTIKPNVKKISDHVYQIGKITFDTQSRKLWFPGKANITQKNGLLEYLLVHKNGEKAHEALLSTDIDAANLNIALKLLNYKESKELFRKLKEVGVPGDTYFKVEDKIRKAARFTIQLTWKENEKKITRPVTTWIKNTETGKALSPTPWVYNGSYVWDKKFYAKLSGTMIGIYPNIGAIANYPGEDRYDDTLFVAMDKLPETGTPLTITFTPWKGKLKKQILKYIPSPKDDLINQ